MANFASILTKTTYKALLKTASRLDALVPRADVAMELGRMSSASIVPGVAASFRAAVRTSFRTVPTSGIDSALVALREGNTRLAQLMAPRPTAAAAAAGAVRAPLTKYAIGQVFRHRVFGYRAVIIAADTACRASPDWVASTGAARLARGTAQPFYTCLVDIRDRPAVQVSYVAEENVELLSAPPLGGGGGGDTGLPGVLHPLIAKHFAAYERGLFLAVGTGGSGDDDESSAKWPKSMAA